VSASVPASAVFLDRDGTVIEDVGFPRDPENVSFVAGAPEGLRRLTEAGLPLVVISNQSGIGRGIVTTEEARAVHDRVVAELEQEGIALAGAWYCPHAPDAGCACRKPRPGMLRAAGASLGLDLSASFMVGDRPSDAEAGRRAGCETVLLAGERVSAGDAAHVASDWGDAVDFILSSRVPA
jgi:D-glycero-D-manno-heptose 1,7-bisphosphate phosphatase